VQPKPGSNEAAVHAAADHGTAGAGTQLPHIDRIQQSFGGYDVTGVRAHTDDAAIAANAEMGSQAYARGNDVAFGGAPDLRTAGHEAAHVVQQRAGVQLKGGVGERGDAYERHADAVADKVVAGGSTEALLATMAGSPAGRQDTADAVQHAVQFIGTPLDKTAPADEPNPAFGEDKGVQRRFSPEQYIAMWEKEQGRPMTADEKKTINRGCIGLTAANLQGGGNPLATADDASNCFWHANHMQYKDAKRAAEDPMKVLQSTREKFVKGYLDFDRIVFGVALAHNYNPGLAAMAHAGPH